ncbi:MAG: hypothetical protein K0R27_4550 [Xanthobacteraceae bacterium]|jgi:hypothetical protein|nr:hypothetical protein [Xanthobacteraceae bacterium]
MKDRRPRDVLLPAWVSLHLDERLYNRLPDPMHARSKRIARNG